MTKNRFRSFLKVRKLSKKFSSIQTKPKVVKKEAPKKLEEKIPPKKNTTEEPQAEIQGDFEKKEYTFLKPLEKKKSKKEGELEGIVSDAPTPEKKNSEQEFRGYDSKKVGYDLQKNLYGTHESLDEAESTRHYEHRGVVNEPTALYETSLRDHYETQDDRAIKTESHEKYSDITHQKKKRGIF